MQTVPALVTNPFYSSIINVLIVQKFQKMILVRCQCVWSQYKSEIFFIFGFSLTTLKMKLFNMFHYNTILLFSVMILQLALPMIRRNDCFILQLKRTIIICHLRSNQLLKFSGMVINYRILKPILWFTMLIGYFLQTKWYFSSLK